MGFMLSSPQPLDFLSFSVKRLNGILLLLYHGGKLAKEICNTANIQKDHTNANKGSRNPYGHITTNKVPWNSTMEAQQDICSMLEAAE